MWPWTEQSMDGPKVLARVCPLEQKQVILREGGACFCASALTSFVKTCAVGAQHL